MLRSRQCALLVLMNYDTPAPERRRRIGTITAARLVIVNHAAVRPDLDPESVHSATACHLSVDRREQKTITSGAVDGPHALVLRASPRNQQPRV